MGRRSPKLEGKEDAVSALFKYLKQQSGMTLLELEGKFTPRQCNKKEDGNDDHGGRQWSRWITGRTQPDIRLVIDVYSFVCDKLITGVWNETGTESLWASLLPAVTDPKLVFMLEKKSTLLKILKRLDELDENLVGKMLLRAISYGYYIPTEHKIREIFWSKTEKNASEYGDGYHLIIAENENEQIEMESLLTDFMGKFGITEENCVALEEFASHRGFVGNDPSFWADQIRGQIQTDAKLLSEISQRVLHVYPHEFRYSSCHDFGDTKNNKKNFFKMQEDLAFASRKFQAYSELTNKVTKPSMIYGLYSKLSHDHFLSNGCVTRIGWNGPTVDILY